MKVNFDVKLMSLRKKPIKMDSVDGDVVKKVEMTLRDACFEALLQMTEDDRNEKGTSKHKRWKLADKVESADRSTEFTPEEIVQMKDRVGNLFSPIIVGPVYTLLDGGSDGGKKTKTKKPSTSSDN